MLRSKILTLLSPVIHRRCLSSVPKSPLTLVEVNDKSGIATLSMNRPPVNLLDIEMMNSIIDSITEIECNKSRGLILTSSNDRVFCAGLDLNELQKPNPERLKEFWAILQDLWLALHLCSVPTAAAINGQAPAGGCLLATACEYRVMMPELIIGINAVRFSYVVPRWFMLSYMSVLPRLVAERALTQGKLFTTAEALQVGLVDEIAASKEEAISKCSSFIGTFSKVNSIARSLTKKQFRESDVQKLLADRAGDIKASVEYISSPLLQEGLAAYLKELKSRSSFKPQKS
ncbi:enoyl-CoA delta isomerase 1, mitochondrial-like [Drosophila tropicalis]|uniref:enoyl-CoA delta isomerase 1, mitochondrial-like n=1 Tax=Drosophila tropicalis TaxID=46794 RepID=UPI0035AC1EBA